MKKTRFANTLRFEKLFKRGANWRLRDQHWRKIANNWERAFTRLRHLGGSSHGNRVDIFNQGDDAFLAICEAIDNAKHLVCFEMYIFEPDRIGTMIRDSLCNAAKRGCQVILLYDHFGSAYLSSSFLAPLIQAGGRALAFNPIWPWRKIGPFHYRDHRKIIIVDNETAFCGGLNVSEDYAGKKLGRNRFRDTLLQIRGPAVSDLAQAFAGSLKETTGEKFALPPLAKAFSDGVFCQVLGSNTRRSLLAIQRSMEISLLRATKHCYFTTPYFLPYAPLKNELLHAAKRGIDIRIITAGLSDLPLMRQASQHIYGIFLEAGIRIYEMYSHTMHAKTATIDGLYSWVGSYNLDHWSARRNLELNVSVFDSTTAHTLEKQFNGDLSGCREVTMTGWKKRPWYMKVIQWCSYQLMRF